MNREQRRARGQRPRNRTADQLHALTGIPFDGGCDDCDAFQTVDDRDAPVFILRVHHDDTCPTLRAMEGR